MTRTDMSLQTLNPSSSVEDVVAAIHQDGACIIRDALSPGTLRELEADLNPWIERTPTGVEAFGGFSTKRTGALIARCPTTRPIAQHPLVIGTAEAFLTPYCERIQLNNTQLITLMPGQGAQPLHRDRLVWGGGGGGYLPMPIEPQFNAIWAVTDFTKENGATVVVPGSQKWDFDRKATPEETVQAEMTRGSVLLYSGTVLHGGGMNNSDSRRVAMNITYTLSWLRQEENQYISCPPAIAKELDEGLTDLIGYSLANFALGFCSDPLKAGEYSDVLSPEMVALGRLPREYAGMTAGDDGAPQMA
jgi:ectoine hydroxylase-related dioxygenase (phytanoyl-CoA dioxygenase family)